MLKMIVVPNQFFYILTYYSTFPFRIKFKDNLNQQILGLTRTVLNPSHFSRKKMSENVRYQQIERRGFR